jgi:hypothetical protein
VTAAPPPPILPDTLTRLGWERRPQPYTYRLRGNGRLSFILCWGVTAWNLWLTRRGEWGFVRAVRNLDELFALVRLCGGPRRHPAG